ncbi:hypothetical protein FXO38_12116 [Capsicum annuum]|nr:hypothetical protein FXO38_12116 [Capsicum annuum]KAF3671225.1 hypothetical protein FXO37_08151 [Capsicum annuum]
MADERRFSMAGSTDSVPDNSNDNSVDTTDAKKRKEMESRSTVWEYFENIFENGENLAECISNCLLDWKLDNVFTVTVDNASSNNVTVSVLSKKLDIWGTNVMDGLIQSDDWFNVRNVIKFLERFYVLTLKVSGLRLNTNTLRNKLYMKKKERDCGIIGGTKSELDKYLGEDQKPVPKPGCESECEDFDILNWWKVNSPRFTILSLLARDVLTIPMSSVASECAFSTGGRILDPFRRMVRCRHPDLLSQVGRGIENFVKCELRVSTQEDSALTMVAQNSNKLALRHLAELDVPNNSFTGKVLYCLVLIGLVYLGLGPKVGGQLAWTLQLVPEQDGPFIPTNPLRDGEVTVQVPKTKKKFDDFD